MPNRILIITDDVLKIDKSFVNDILSPSDDGSIVSANMPEVAYNS